ncbi:hypothetical protein Tdes44962_MAKER01850 [Teratosphaeria destructans]|uniref:Uncharacterized protein n=1 Tax=Teratosphaeria destructans TaxID=418781 RepID=A0A9W7W538_9PEZI|nr:hypothetical protein Tdes44962_MAKER01850 [Teratosphaeria destructans]
MSWQLILFPNPNVAANLLSPSLFLFLHPSLYRSHGLDPPAQGCLLDRIVEVDQNEKDSHARHEKDRQSCLYPGSGLFHRAAEE